jgi:hypothetical protein
MKAAKFRMAALTASTNRHKALHAIVSDPNEPFSRRAWHLHR